MRQGQILFCQASSFLVESRYYREDLSTMTHQDDENQLLTALRLYS